MTADALIEFRAEKARGGRVRRAVMTWSAGALYTGVTLAVGFVTTPLLIKFLGADRLGASRAATEWMGYLVLADLGLGSAVSVLLLRARGNRDESARIGITKFALRLFTILSAVAIIFGGVLAWNMPHLIRVPREMSRELRVAAMISLAGLLVMPLNIFRNVLETEQRGYLVHLALLIQSLLISVIAVALAWREWGLVGQSIAMLIGAIIFASLISIWAIRGMKEFSRCSHPRTSVATNELWKLSWPLALGSLGVRMNLMTDSIVTGFILGPATVTSLFVTQRLIQLCGAQVNSLSNASWAALAELRAAGEHRAFASRVCELTRLVVGVGITFTGTIAAYNIHFVRLWVGQANYGGDLLSALAAGASVLVGITLLFCWIIDSHGDTRKRLPVSIAGALANLAMSIFFARKIGLPGILLGTVVAQACTDAWFCPFIVIRHYNVPARELLLAVMRGLVRGLPWAIGAWILAHTHVPPARWFGLSLELGCVALASLVYCWSIVLTSEERAQWQDRMRGRSRKSESC